MAEFPALPLWTDAYTADCSHLSDAEHGRYLLLLMAMWRAPDQRLPNDDEWLARRFKRTVGDITRDFRPLIKEFCKSTGNWITQKRLQREFAYLVQQRKKQSDRAKARWEKEKDQSRGNASRQASGNASSGNAPTPTPTPLINSLPIAAPKAPRRAHVALTEVTAEIVGWAAEHAPGVDPAAELPRYLDWNRASRKPHVDQTAGFRNWLREQHRRNNRNGGANGYRHGNAERERTERRAAIAGAYAQVVEGAREPSGRGAGGSDGPGRGGESLHGASRPGSGGGDAGAPLFGAATAPGRRPA